MTMMGETDLHTLAARLRLELGSVPVEGRYIVDWIVSNTEECASCTMRNEGVLVAGLLLERGLLSPCSDGGDGARLGGGDPLSGQDLALFQNERRTYAILSNGDGGVLSSQNGAGGIKRVTSWIDTKALAHPGGCVGPPLGSVIDPPELLQLPPHELSARLRCLALALRRNLKPAPPSSGRGGRGAGREEEDEDEFAGEDVVAWLLTGKPSFSSPPSDVGGESGGGGGGAGGGVVDTSAHAMLLGNMLVNSGYLKPSERSLRAIAAADRHAAKQRAETRGGGDDLGSGSADPGMPFSDAPTTPLLLSKPAVFPAANSDGGGGDDTTNTAAAAAAEAANQRSIGTGSPDFVTNPRVAALRFTFTVDSQSGCPLPPVPTAEADALLAQKASAKQQAEKNSQGGLQRGLAREGGGEKERAQVAVEAELLALERMVAAEEMALLADQQALEDNVASLSSLEQQCRKAAQQLSAEESAVTGTRHQLLRHQFLLESRQVKLLSEVQSIYPIHPLSPGAPNGQHANGYESGGGGAMAIRSLELPRDLSSTTAGLDDEHVSSALGYVVHVVCLLSKYLGISLRYQLLYASSRSSVRDRVAHANAQLLWQQQGLLLNAATSANGLSLGSSGQGGGGGGGGANGCGCGGVEGGGGGVGGLGGSGSGSGLGGLGVGADLLGLGAASALNLGADGLGLLGAASGVGNAAAAAAALAGGGGGMGGAYPLWRGRDSDPVRFKRGCAMLAANVEQILWARGVRSEAVVRSHRPPGDNDGHEGGASGVNGFVAGGLSEAVSGTDMLRNIEKLFRYEICPQLT